MPLGAIQGSMKRAWSIINVHCHDHSVEEVKCIYLAPLELCFHYVMARFAYKMPRYKFLELPLAIKEAIHTLNKEVFGVPVAATKNIMYCLVLK